MGENKDVGARLFSVVPNKKTVGTKKYRKIHLNARDGAIAVESQTGLGPFKDHLVKLPCHRQGHLFLDQVAQSCIVVEHWNRLPGEVVESPCLEIIKAQLEKFLSSLLLLVLL